MWRVVSLSKSSGGWDYVRLASNPPTEGFSNSYRIIVHVPQIFQKVLLQLSKTRSCPKPKAESIHSWLPLKEPVGELTSTMAGLGVTGSKSQLLQTALAAIDGYNAWNMDAILAPRADYCIQEILPRSLERPLLNNTDYRAYFEPLVPAFKNFHVTIVEVVEDSKNHKVAIHASSTAGTVIGPYKNEYMLLFQMTEDDKQIVHLKEFVDSVVSVNFIKQIREHMASQAGNK